MSPISYYPSTNEYWTDAETIYAQYIGKYPNPCRKYYVSSATKGAEHIAELVLPLLSSRAIFHKIVKNARLLERQTRGPQAGKFITFYMNQYDDLNNAIIRELDSKLLSLRDTRSIEPCARPPRSRLMPWTLEKALDQGHFLYGGFICDPTV